MTDTIIKVEGLSKRYRIGEARARYQTFREMLVNMVKARFRIPRRQNMDGQSENLFWALNDVSFEVKQSEIIGIIGQNGAGKSTLLKILSRITEPTKGRVEIHGRVASLLEVGTGFHQELTGRENIYVNGSIMGMKRREIDAKFDQIVSFAEIEKFIDTPVKHYSSGMYVRLAFAVAAHLEPEVLLVDEVLAVGDASFQKKCLGKMEDVAKQGRTVLFVSHNMAAIRTLCHRAILLKQGQILLDAGSSEAIERYMAMSVDIEQPADRSLEHADRVEGGEIARITRIALRSEMGKPQTSFSIWEPMVVELGVKSKDLPEPVSLWVCFYSSYGSIVLSVFQYDVMRPFVAGPTEKTVRVHIDPNGLVPGNYSLAVGVVGRQNESYDWVSSAIAFNVRTEFHTGKAFDHRLGDISLKYRWEIV
jgi:lipopolysaccharide transport system ATP-binding protein